MVFNVTHLCYTIKMVLKFPLITPKHMVKYVTYGIAVAIPVQWLGNSAFLSRVIPLVLEGCDSA